MSCESESDFLLLSKSKRIVGLVMHQDGISEKECFWMFLVFILADSKSGANISRFYKWCYTKAEGFNCVRFSFIIFLKLWWQCDFNSRFRRVSSKSDGILKRQFFSV